MEHIITRNGRNEAELFAWKTVESSRKLEKAEESRNKSCGNVFGP